MQISDVRQSLTRHDLWCLLAISAILAGGLVTPADAQRTRPRTVDSPRQHDPSTWWERAAEGMAGHYWIKTDLPRDQAREVARHLNLIHEAFHQRLGSLPQRQPEQLNVLLFQRYEDYLYVLRSRFDITAIGTGGIFFVRPEGGALAVWIGDRPMQRVYASLQHEAFHQFARSRFGSDLPIWVNEGLAEFFGNAVLVNRTLVIGQSKPYVIESVKTAIEQESYIPFRDMLTMTSDRWWQSLRDGRASTHYQQAWSMVQFLIYGEGGRYQQAFERYLRLMNDGVPSEQAFVRAFETDRIDLFEARWKAYALQATPSAFVTALERIEFLAEGLLELSRRGEHPATLEALREKLRDIEFTHTISNHGMTTVLEASDDAMFEIPMDELARRQPHFVFTRSTRRPSSRRLQMLEDQNPTPPTIATEDLRPHGLRLEWIRDEATNTFTYEIIVR